MLIIFHAFYFSFSVTSFSREKVEALRKLFLAVDTNGDGCIDAHEFDKAFGRNNDKAKAQELINLVQLPDSRDGKLDFREFLLLMEVLEASRKSNDGNYHNTKYCIT